MLIDRRTLAKAVALAGLAPPGARAQRAETDTLVFIGTQASAPDQGIVAARFDARAGTLTTLGTAAAVARPTWVIADPRRPLLYAVSEVGNDGNSQGEVIAFAIVPGGRLREIARVPSGGGGPTHLDLDPRGTALLVANYGSGHVAALPIRRDGGLAPATAVRVQTGSGPSPRQKSAHAHAIVVDPSRRYAVSADLGADRLFVYPFTRVLGAAVQVVPVPAGHGPRHLAFGPDGRFLYVVTELVPEIRVYRWRAGMLDLVEALSTVRDPALAATTRGAEVRVSDDGRFVYVSNRGEDTIIGYAIDPRSGRLREMQRIAAGKVPWSFTLHPSGRWAIVADQGSDSIALFRRDPTTGLLRATGQSIAVSNPTSIAFASPL